MESSKVAIASTPAKHHLIYATTLVFLCLCRPQFEIRKGASRKVHSHFIVVASASVTYFRALLRAPVTFGMQRFIREQLSHFFS
jgi:hypothetical protein